MRALARELVFDSEPNIMLRRRTIATLMPAAIRSSAMVNADLRCRCCITFWLVLGNDSNKVAVILSEGLPCDTNRDLRGVFRIESVRIGLNRQCNLIWQSAFRRRQV